MPSLYEAGWRLGSIFTASLPLDSVILGPGRTPERRQTEHGHWVVATQECDLDLSDSEEAEPTIEVRPVHTDQEPPDWGLRSSRFRLNETDHVRARDPRLFVSPAVLTGLIATGAQVSSLSEGRSRGFALWLGRRYDRPAVPPHLVDLAKAIAVEVSRKSERVTGAELRDVLMQFDDTQEPVRFTMVAILQETADEDRIREWLASIATKIPPELGIADELLAAPSDQISLHLIETSYAADVAQVTWRPNSSEPTGAA